MTGGSNMDKRIVTFEETINRSNSAEPGNHVILGCDIGNGFGYVSALMKENEDPERLFPGSSGFDAFGMPTTAYITPPSGKPIVVCQNGKTAEKLYQNKPEQLVRAIKTQLERTYISIPDVENPVKVSDIYAAAARDLITLANQELSARVMPRTHDIVFTFPAAFCDNLPLLEQMQSAIEQIEIDGQKIHVAGRLPEPAAVAIDYLHYIQHIVPEEQRIKADQFTVLVYDLGYGTFDTAVVTASSKDQPYVLHAKDGLPEVGGKNFDDVLYNEICRQLKKQYGYVPQNAGQREEIRTEAIKAKIELSSNEKALISVMGKDDYYEVEITRERFEELSRHLLDQTLELVQRVMDDVKGTGITIDSVVLSGGASQMPMVRNNLEQMLEGRYPILIYRPSQAVSFGAARYGYMSQRILTQLTDCCYGIWMPSEDSEEGEVRFLVQSGQQRPAVSEKLTFYSGSSHLNLRIYRSRAKNTQLEKASEDECESVINMPFDVTPGSQCTVIFEVYDDYGVALKLTTDHSERYLQSSKTMFRNLSEQKSE